MPPLSYHLGELSLAREANAPQHLLPNLGGCRVGIVDVGCGIGQLLVAKDAELPPGVARYGVDIDADAIAYAREHWPNLATFASGKAEQLPVPSGSVDYYVARVSLPYTHLPSSLDEAFRVLVPGGHLWITLHPARMVLAELVRAIRVGRVRALLGRARVLYNGLRLELNSPPSRESWQSGRSITRLLRNAGFEQVQIMRTRQHFLVEAIRSQTAMRPTVR